MGYYKEKKENITFINSFTQREFGVIPWTKEPIMMRHMSFINKESLINFLINNGPKHVYSSGALYDLPESQNMAGKGYQKCDLIIDVDVDHFYTPCKDKHDLWICKNCGKLGRGMPNKCPACKKLRLKTLPWICEDCLDSAKKEIIKLIYNFLIPDFDIDLSQMKIAFSGHRGYHLKVENEKIRTLTSNERREITDYITGENISFEVLGLQERTQSIFGFFKQTIGWPQKIIRRIEEILRKPNLEIENLLSDKRTFNLNKNLVKSLLSYKEDFLNMLNNEQKNNWTIEGFGLNTWHKFLNTIVSEIGIEVDTPVTIDIHRLIRYPGSLHGKTGFKVQELYPDQLEDFYPLDEPNEKLDPIVFESEKKITQKIKIIEPNVPATKMKGETHGPYVQGEIIEVPHHIAVFLLCKGVAKTV